MTQTTKNILIEVIKRLDAATETTWDRGDLEDFSRWSARMKTTIASAITVLKTIANSQEEPCSFVVEDKLKQLAETLTKEDLIQILIATGKTPQI